MNLPPLLRETLCRQSSQFPNPMASKDGFRGLEQESQKRDEPRTTGSKGKGPYVS